jgi:hypothetical protein
MDHLIAVALPLGVALWQGTRLRHLRRGELRTYLAAVAGGRSHRKAVAAILDRRAEDNS